MVHVSDHADSDLIEMHVHEYNVHVTASNVLKNIMHMCTGVVNREPGMYLAMNYKYKI